MLRLPALFLLTCWLSTASLGAQLDSLLLVLDRELDHRAEYLQQKQDRLQQLDAARAAAPDAATRFDYTLDKVLALESFSFRQAYASVTELRRLAEEIGDEQHIKIAKLREAFIFLSAGLFNEALDSLNTIDPAGLPPAVKVDYYATRARTHFDLADNYDVTRLQKQSQAAGLSDLDSALVHAGDDELARLTLRGNKALRLGDTQLGLSLYHRIRQHPQRTTRLMAREHGAAGVLYNLAGQRDSAVVAITRSAIADERTVTREAISLVRLARHLYERGDYERSARYIRIGLENANFFDARHRKMEVLDILPVIEEQRQVLLRRQRQQFAGFAILVSLLFVLALWLIRRTILQNRQLQEGRQALVDTYEQLRENNAALREAERIKEEYIGYFFQSNTKFIAAAKRVIDKASQAVYAADFKEAKYQLKSYNAKQQHQLLLRDFDKVFLDLFPNFVDRFRQLFPADNPPPLGTDGALSTEVRIFALTRLGVSNNDTIAKILGYSVNTIYAYRSKLRGRSTLDKEAFDRAVMAIEGTEKTPSLTR